MSDFEGFLRSLILALCILAIPAYSTQYHKPVTQPFAPSLEERHKAHKVLCEHQKPCKALAEAVYFEARGEQFTGQVAVAHTILNRVKHKAWPNTVSGVIYQRCQFSYNCDGSKDRGVQNEDAWGVAKLVAWGVLNDLYFDPTSGADHYLEPNKVSEMPRWTKVYPLVATIGNHKFYKRGEL